MDDISDLITFLVSNQSEYMTGQDINNLSDDRGVFRLLDFMNTIIGWDLNWDEVKQNRGLPQ